MNRQQAEEMAQKVSDLWPGRMKEGSISSYADGFLRMDPLALVAVLKSLGEKSDRLPTLASIAAEYRRQHEDRLAKQSEARARQLAAEEFASQKQMAAEFEAWSRRTGKTSRFAWYLERHRGRYPDNPISPRALAMLQSLIDRGVAATAPPVGRVGAREPGDEG